MCLLKINNKPKNLKRGWIMMKNEKIALIIIGNNNIEKCIENIRKQSYINDI